MTALCTVMGDPIDHSLSPQIHAIFAGQTGVSMSYTKTHVPANTFAEAVRAFKQEGGLGANITVPLKELAYEYADTLTDRAALAGAVNTLHFTEAGVLGDNTDGVGLVTDLLEHLELTLFGLTVLVVGAGGAARGILQPLLDARCQVTVANRTVKKAENMAKTYGGKIQACGLSEPAQPFDLVINATAASLSGEALPLNPEILDTHTVCYDLMYANQPTVFMQWAQRHDVTRVYDGLGMLVGQAAHAFARWHGVMPEIAPVLRILRL